MIPQPLRNKMIVLPMPTKTVTESGIFIPETAQERSSKAVVIAVGGGSVVRPMVFAVGDTVSHIKNAGDPIEIDGVEHFILRDVDCHYRIPKD
jgi:chaperonin GroES